MQARSVIVDQRKPQRLRRTVSSEADFSVLREGRQARHPILTDASCAIDGEGFWVMQAAEVKTKAEADGALNRWAHVADASTYLLQLLPDVERPSPLVRLCGQRWGHPRQPCNQVWTPARWKHITVSNISDEGHARSASWDASARWLPLKQVLEGYWSTTAQVSS